MRLTKNLFLMLFSALLLPMATAAPHVLKYSDHEPLGNMRTRFINEVFFPAIEKESNGRLKIEAHWNSELSTSYDALSSVGQKGIADMTVVVPEYTAKELPLHQLFKSFPVGPTRDKQVAFFRRVYAEIPAFPAELEKQNVVNVFFATGFPVAFFSGKPLKTLDDIKGQTWRTASFWHKDFIQNFGATPVTMPWNAGIYKAMKAGTLDGLMVNVDGGYDLKVYEIAPNILYSEDLWMGHVYLLSMNKNTWDGLAKEDQAAIQRAADTAYKTLGTVMATSFNAQVDVLRRAGATVRVLDLMELEQWKTATRYIEVQDAWVKDQESKGVKDAGATLEKVRSIINDSLNNMKTDSAPVLRPTE